jgi:hypothetical protein
LLIELWLTGAFLPSVSTGGNMVIEELRRTCRLFISLRSISVGGVTTPNISRYHRGFEVVLLTSPLAWILFNDELLSISNSGENFLELGNLSRLR